METREKDGEDHLRNEMNICRDGSVLHPDTNIINSVHWITYSQQFTSTHRGIELHGDLGLLMESLNAPFLFKFTQV